MTTYTILDGRLSQTSSTAGAELVDTGVRVKVNRAGCTVFSRAGKGLASYGTGVDWSTAMMRFVKDYLGDPRGSVMVYDSRRNVAPPSCA